MKNLTAGLIFLITAHLGTAQKVYNIRLIEEDGYISVCYDLEGDSGQYFYVDCVVSRDSTVLNSENFLGDVGTGMTSGVDKKAQWLYREDGLEYDSSWYVEVKAKLMPNYAPKEKPVVILKTREELREEAGKKRLRIRWPKIGSKDRAQ